MCQLLFAVGLLMTCLRWTSAAAVPEGTVYVGVNGTAVLHPGSAVTGDIRKVLWKYNDDIAAELYRSVTISYLQFKGRCELNAATGELTIKHLTLSDSGSYSVEINGKETNTVQLQVMNRVSKPSVSTWCDPLKTYCLLTCEGTTSDPESLQYRWKEENDWSHSVKVLKITKENKEPEFSCELKNPVSSSRSDPVQNPFITGSLLWIIAVVLVILLIVIVAVVLYYKRKHICQKGADAEKNEGQQKQRVQPPTSGPVGTVYEEVDGTAVLHPGSALTGDIKTVTWKLNSFNIAEWEGMDLLFYRHSHKGRCELNTRTGALTIKHLTLSDSGFYSAEINGYEVNTVQLQVMSKKTAAADGVQLQRNFWSHLSDLIARSRTTDPEKQADQPATFKPGEAGDEEEPGETMELLSQSDGDQQESRGGGGVQQESRGGGGVQQESRGGGGVQQESRGGGGVQQGSRGGGVQQESRGDGVQQESRGGGDQQESRGGGDQQESRGDGVQQESRGGAVQQEPTDGGDRQEPTDGHDKQEPTDGHDQQEPTDGVQQESTHGGDQEESRGGVNDPPDVSSAVTSSSGSSADVHHDSAQSPGAAGSSASSTDSGDGTVYEEVGGTAVLHPGSAHTGDIRTGMWKYNGSEVVTWAGKTSHFYGQFKGRCELNTRTGELTIKHLTLSHSGSYSVKINDLLVNRVQLQVMSKKTAAAEGTVHEVNGTAVLHPGSAHTGDINNILWKHNGYKAVVWAGKRIFFYQQFKGRCELNIRTGELTINHLTLSHSGSYSVKINNKVTNTVQLQVMNKSSV